LTSFDIKSKETFTNLELVPIEKMEDDGPLEHLCDRYHSLTCRHLLFFTNVRAQRNMYRSRSWLHLFEQLCLETLDLSAEQCCHRTLLIGLVGTDLVSKVFWFSLLSARGTTNQTMHDEPRHERVSLILAPA